MFIPRVRSAASEVTPLPWEPNIWAMAAAISLLLGVLGGLTITLATIGPFARDEFRIWQWTTDNTPSTLFQLTGVARNTDIEAGQEAARLYFSLTSQIRAELQALNPDAQLLDTLANERAIYENDVERLVEGYISEAIEDSDIASPMPLFSDWEVVWPPVEIELTSPPQLLVTSPRSEIVRADRLLRNDLTVEEIEAIEADTDNDDQVSLVISIGGIAAYPAIIRDQRSYDSLLNVTGHEWAHHHLSFYPLGLEWGSGSIGRTLNESTADIVGRELAHLVRQAHPIQFEPGEDGRRPPGEAPTVEFSPVMRQLRIDVDELLADGNVAEAEALMEETRLFLADNGIHIRKINQAYFAFYGDYGESPASSSPIGPKVDQVWELTKDVGIFLKIMREVTNERSLDAAISALEGGG
jgi:hypothetical protein